ncbi:tail assembly chaperone [Macrococcus capreoli]|uniref:tail assembly chaperone n=1 Tax=Macrococcus capreoli TaxID=2982690 RepID=UPI0021D5B25B|nr:tail assembly chaperone [Macrococcus sp. TMW 2.2395]MCU7556531.1 tail assembly chaperone [Macrococcus sp. TMW 2.2395]
MNITIKDETYELNLGIGFALSLDSKYKFKQQITQDLDAEFGLGVQILFGQLTAVSVQAIVDYFKAGLVDVQTKKYSEKDLNKAIQDKAVELGGFQPLAEACIEALQNVGLYNHIFVQVNQTISNEE